MLHAATCVVLALVTTNICAILNLTSLAIGVLLSVNNGIVWPYLFSIISDTPISYPQYSELSGDDPRYTLMSLYIK